jgi:dienelactone hydrolase
VAARAAVLVVAAWLALATAARADSSITEEALRVPFPAPGAAQLTLVARLYRPSGSGPFPLAVMNHGASSPTEAAKPDWLDWYAKPSRWFAARGYATLLLMRRAYAGSEGTWVEGYGPCANPVYHEVGLETARDIRAGVEFARTRPDVDGTRIVLIGHSAGAHGALALASTDLPGLEAVINFAGGRGGGNPSGHCASDRLVATMGRWAATTTARTLWIYAENDEIFAPPLVRRMHAAHVQAGGHAELHVLSVPGAAGHSFFNRAGGESLWGPLVRAFLARLYLPS